MPKLIRLDDFHRLAELIRDVGAAKVAQKIFRSDQGKIESAWEHTESRRSNWWDLDDVVRRWNKLITGSPSVDYQTYVAGKYFGRDRGLRALSIGCGTGTKEIAWAATGKFSTIDAYDLLSSRIERARVQAARSKWARQLSFQVGDVRSLELEASSYDVVIFDNSLHHCSPLGTVLQNVSRWMKKNGVLVLNEYVGPDRFQWTDRQVEWTDTLLLLLPERLRITWNGRIKKRTRRYGTLALTLSDPSEAGESSSVLAVAAKYFRLCELIPYGGTILANLLKDIAHNFRNGDPESRAWLAFLFGVEDRLLRERIVSSDYVFAVLKKQ